MLSGYQLNYAGSLPNFPPGKITIRHILLLWTGDHPANVKCVRLRELEARKDVEDVIYVVGGVGQCKM